MELALLVLFITGHALHPASAWLVTRPTSIVPSLLPRRCTERWGRRCLLRRASASAAIAEVVQGLEFWRSLPEANVPDLEDILYSAYNDIPMEELELNTIREVNLLHLPSAQLPCVGQLRRIQLSMGSRGHQALLSARKRHGGFIACPTEIIGSKVLPRGCVGAEIVSLAPSPDGYLNVEAELRSVVCLRILERRQRDAVATIVQEVDEWTSLEEKNGEALVFDELQRLKKLFASCGKLQARTGFFHAGDMASKSLDDLTTSALDVLADVRLGGLAGDLSLRRHAVVTAHAAVSALKRDKLETFLCDPTSVLRRLRELNKFLDLMERVLQSQL